MVRLTDDTDDCADVGTYGEGHAECVEAARLGGLRRVVGLAFGLHVLVARLELGVLLEHPLDLVLFTQLLVLQAALAPLPRVPVVVTVAARTRRDLGVHRTVRVAQERGDLVHDHPGLPPLEAVTLGELRTQPQHLLATRGFRSVAVRAPHRTLTGGRKMRLVDVVQREVVKERE